MEIKVEATSKNATKTAKGEYTGIKYQGKWVNVWGDHVGTKGQTLNITNPEQFKQADGTLSKTFWAKIIEPESESEQEAKDKPASSKRTWDDVTRKAEVLWSRLMTIVQSPEGMPAIASTINIIMNSYIRNEIDDSESEDNPQEVPF